MAQIIVTATPVNLNVSTTQSNITVTDVETNVTVNVASLSSNIAVTSTPVNVTISPSIGVSNAEIRAALSATTPIVYDNNTGEFTFDPSANNMQVTSLTASGFVTTTGNLTSSGLSVSGNATVGGLLNVSNISIAGDLNANLKDISLSYYDAGNVSGNVTLDVANGPVQKIRLTNNLTGLTFTGATAAQPITLIIQQDNVGFWTLDTSTFASNWTNWLFTSNFKTLSTTANATDLLSITYNGTSYFASLVNFVQTLITNAELANSNVVVNGTTINLGSSGNISHFGALTTTNLAEGTNLYFSAARVRGNVSAATPLTYNSSTGEFGFADFAQIGGLNVNSTQGYSGVSLRVNKYTGGGNPNAMDVIGNATVSERLTVTGNVQGNFFIGNGSQLTGVTTLTNAQVIANIATQPLTVGGNLTVNGNINATGNINVQNVEDLYVRDQTIVMNANAASPANVQIVSNRPGSANTEIKWNEQTDRWTFTNDGSTYYNLPTSTTDVAEGTNLYYTTDRANTAIGAYQGDINTPGTITAGISNATTVNATTVNVTDLNATNNVTVLGKLNAADGSNIQYVRAYSADLVTDSGANGLNVILESQSNNRLAKASSDSIRYVPDTRTLLVTDGTIGSSAANTSFSGNSLFLSGNIIAGNISVNTVTAGSLSGNGTLITAITGANVFGLVTTQVSEGTNLYYTTDRANTAIANYQGNINTAGNIQGNYILGNGSQLTGIPANIVGSENINVTGNVVSLDNALSNVYSITTDGQDFTINTNSKLVLTEQLKNVTTYTGNINGEGYAIFNGVGARGLILSHTGTGELLSYVLLTGNTTAGSNVITDVTIVDSNDEVTPASLDDVSQYYVWDYSYSSAQSYPFPIGTYIVSADSANGTLTMSQSAIETYNVDYSSGDLVTIYPGAVDLDTGLMLGLLSPYSSGVGASKTTIQTEVLMQQGVYGYPAIGPQPADFSYAIDTVSDYASAGTLDLNKLIARTNINAPRTVLSAPRGLVIGDGDLTGRAENDTFPVFGLNILWDGLDTSNNYAGNTPNTQLLLKSYTDNSSQSSSSARANFGPRLFFTAAEGNKNEPYQITYPRKDLELGRITWWGPTQFVPAESTPAPPAWISGVTGQDHTTTNSGIGMYFANSPNTSNYARGLYFANTKGNTLIAGGYAGNSDANIVFAPMDLTVGKGSAPVNGNSVIMHDYATKVGKEYGKFGYANMSAQTGSQLTVTNGGAVTAGTAGDLQVTLERSNTTGNVILTSFDGTNYLGGQNPDRVRFPGALTLPNGTPVTINGFTNATVAGALNGNVFYVSSIVVSNIQYYRLYSDSALTTPVNLSVSNINAGPGTFEFALTGSVTPKIWNIALEEASNDLKFKSDGTTVATITDGGNISATAFYGDGGNLTNVTATANTFENIIVAGQANVVAMGSTNLTLAAGSGMTITTDAGTDTITFSSTGGYGNAEVAAFLAAYGSNTITTTGTITAGAFIGDGSDLTSVRAETVEEKVINKSGGTLAKGTPVYATGGVTSDALWVAACDASNAATMPCIGILATSLANDAEGRAILAGRISGVDTSAFSAGDQIYVAVGGGYANVPPPSESNIVQFLGTVTRVDATTGGGIVHVSEPQEEKNLNSGNIFIGNTSNVTVSKPLVTAITDANVKLKQFSETTVALGNVTGDQSSNINLANGSIFTMTATGNLTISSVTNAVAGSSATLIITQDGTGGRTLTSTMKFAGASKTLSTAANAIDIISLFYDGTTYYATLSKGYA